MVDQTSQLVLSLDAGQKTDVEELAELTRQLREELLELDVEDVDLAKAGEIPAKAKAGDPISWGILLVELAVSSGVLTILAKMVQSWLTRDERYSITLEISGDKLELKGISSQKQQQLIEYWISRHSESVG